MSEEIPKQYITNYEQFRDILSSFLIERIATPFTKPKPKPKRRSKKKKPTNPSPPPTPPETADTTDPDASADDLADFTSYIATATFLALPADLQSLTYHTWLDNPHFATTLYPLPLTAELTTSTLLPTLDPSIPDSLATYGITAPSNTPSDLPSPAEFLAAVLGAYVGAATAPPPPPASTRADAAGCEICGRDWINLSYHHLIPRMVHGKAVRRGWHRADELQNVAWLCGACHRFVHRFAGHEVLAREYYTVERLLGAEEVRRFGEWVGRVRWKAR